MELEPTYATTVLPPERIEALDAQLASMEVTLNLLRFARVALGAVPPETAAPAESVEPANML